ncbi:MAG TPA: tRNA (adenosine(37)-N6)-threonylcarbamoyltransferase complex ATPase subunit type 1 TsaE [Thermoanaerobaculia bacterium]|nr:tRNA (adenosine(37)-N6)-threonylcarbamoyltransferase complex ATPase subunit type 1 TsaE [Thermoanaerobaculia bacterium]
MIPREFLSRSEEETAEIGRRIAADLPSDGVVEVRGDLGAGKTTLIRAIASELGADPLEIGSPSFAIVHEYPRFQGPAIVHVDGYRLSNRKREWLEIGIDELLTSPGLKFIEWPKQEFSEIADTSARIRVEVDPDGEGRRIHLEIAG